MKGKKRSGRNLRSIAWMLVISMLITLAEPIGTLGFAAPLSGEKTEEAENGATIEDVADTFTGSEPLTNAFWGRDAVDPADAGESDADEAAAESKDKSAADAQDDELADTPDADAANAQDADIDSAQDADAADTQDIDAAEERKTDYDPAETPTDEYLNAEGAGNGNYSESYMSGEYFRKLQEVVLTGDYRVDIVNVAKSQVGYHEGRNHNDLSGYGTGQAGYSEYGRMIGSNPNPWCAYFVSWCARQANIPTSIIKSNGTANANGFNVAFYQRGTYEPRSGDLICFKYAGSGYNWDHIGVVVGVDGTYVYTVEGNSSDSVQSRKYKKTNSDIKGYGVPNYPDPIHKVGKPGANVVDIKGGKRADLSCESGAAIHYSLDGAGYRDYGGGIEIKSAGSHTINFYATKAGCNQSDTASVTFNISKAATPSFSKAETASGYKVTLSHSAYGAEIYYSLNGGSYSKYGSPFTVSGTVTVRYYACVNGQANSDTASQTVKTGKPATPVLQLSSAKKAALGSMILLKWNKPELASAYRLQTYRDGSLISDMEYTGLSAAISGDQTGTYEFRLAAKNIWGTSDYSAKVSAQIMPDVTVQYVDWNDTPLTDAVKIGYGKDATPPKSPTREGYDFQGWSHDGKNITTDTVIKALYEKKTFNIVFCDDKGSVVSTQRIKWEESATAPDMTGSAPVGYIFGGWYVDPKNSDCEDYTCVRGKMKLYATYVWENENLPVAIRDLSAKCTYNGAGQYYTANMNLYTSTSTDVRGRVIVEVETEKGTTVAIGSQDVSLPAGTVKKAVSVQINSVHDGNVLHAYMINLDENDRSAGAISAKADGRVTREIFYSDWSDWSTTKPAEGDKVQIESKTQYRYTTKYTTTSTTTNSISGYTLQSTTQNVGSWSGWQDNAVSGYSNVSGKREVETRSVITSTDYDYAHYCTGNVAGAKYQTFWSNQSGSATFNANCVYHYLGRFNENDSHFGPREDGEEGYLYYPSGSKFRCSNSCWTWYRVAAYHTYKTQYRYRDTGYTYHFYKISDYTNWSDSRPSSYYNLQSRTVYRYRTITDENKPTEVDETKARVISGKIKNTAEDLEGKKATVLVYKKTNTDPTQTQMEYVEQITIGKGNSYNFTVIPKEEPSEDTGDYICALAIEGATGLVNIDVINAPKPYYTVTFIAGGKVVSIQKVSDGSAARIPSLTGDAAVDFVRWDASAANVHEDRTIYAEYEEKEYVVVFADDQNGTIELARYAYNAPITKDLPEAPEGFVCKGWDHETVTGDMIVKPVYEKRSYTVTFVDTEGDPVGSPQRVVYGGCAIPPDYTYISTPANMKILGWTKDVCWWEVKEDMVVYPVVEYADTVGMPYVSSSLDALTITDSAALVQGQSKTYPVVTLSTATDTAEVYYTLDGTDPLLSPESAILYKDGITLKKSAVLKAVAIADQMNTSEVLSVELSVAKDEIAPDYRGTYADDDAVETSGENGNEQITDDPEGETGEGTGDEITDPVNTDISTDEQSEADGEACGKESTDTVCTDVQKGKDAENSSGENMQNAPSADCADKSSNDQKEGKETEKKPAQVLIKSAKAKKAGFTLKWCSVAGAYAYEVQYSKNRRFKAAGSEVVTKTKLTVKKLRKKKNYYVRVRAIAYNAEGTLCYGEWSNAAVVKTKK